MSDISRADMTVPFPEHISDEELIDAHGRGDARALDVLFRRYYDQTHFYLLNESLIKDNAFLEDIKHGIMLLVLTKIRDGAFEQSGPGSFRAWFYSIAKKICWNYNYWQTRLPKNICRSALESIPAKPILPPEQEKEKVSAIKKGLSQVLAKLSPAEIDLMKMVGDGMTYKQIHQNPQFAKYSLDYLMRKVYIIRKKMLKGG